MRFEWLKRMMPRGLYGRAALILLVPIVTLQLVVSAAILQRYFEGVARQLSEALALDLALVLQQVEAGRDAQATAQALAIDLFPLPAVAGQDRRAVYDLTGIEVIRVLSDRVPGVLGIDLQSDWRRVQVSAETGMGPVLLSVERRRASASNPHQLLVLIVLTGGFMTLVAYLFLRNQLRPIRRLSHAAEAFGKGRVVDYHPSGAAEVRSAGRAFLDMRGRIEQQIEQRTLMLSGVSHDLRTPLTRMRLGLTMLDPSPEVEALTRDVAEMETLLTTFLDFARSEALDDPEPTDPVTLVQALIEDVTRAGGDVTLVAPGPGARVDLRPQAVRRAVSNLVSNALRYGQRAVVTVDLADRAVRIRVEDDGPGIPADQRADAIRPFIRLDAARNQDKGSGVGLGLAIANDIARKHGGTITLDDSPTLGGLRADLVLPR